jgi:multicomponent Na+:H+ antiporter subunit D
LFLVPAMSLAGVPPFSGFFAKLTLVQAGLDQGEYLLVAVSLAVGFFTLFSMSKIWNEVFAKDPPSQIQPGQQKVPLLMVLPSVWLVVLTVLIGLGAGPMLDLSMRASEQLLNPSEYVAAVLEATGEP